MNLFAMDNSVVNNLCRLCLRLSEDTVSLFDFKNDVLIADLIKIICPIEISKNESGNLPNSVCVDCLDLIVDAVHLRDLSLINDEELRRDIQDESMDESDFKQDGSEKLEDDPKLEDEMLIEALDEATFDGVDYELVESSSAISEPYLEKKKSSHVRCEACNATFCDVR